ncbi:MAG: sigma 54-interacting transcriptional regulator [Acidobacteria bacterium]|nr:sigma 54-interacting transcriptional regulator [Acidobacteriota bacterium]
MRMQDIAKRLKREPSDEPTNTKQPSNPQIESSKNTTGKTRERSAPWMLLEALYNGYQDFADNVIRQSALTDSEKKLLAGMKAAWQEESSLAKQLLNQSATQLIGINKCWAHISLANLFLDLGDDDSVDYSISRARRYAYEDRQDRQCLSVLVELLDARVDIERGAHQRALRTINNTISECSDNFLYGFACYLLACLGRFSEKAAENRIEKLKEATEIFQNLELNHYFLALTKLELSQCDIDIKEALQLAKEAAELLKSLGRKRESGAAQTRANEIEEKLNKLIPTPTPIHQTTTSNERVGTCLFISASMKAIRLKLDAISAADKDPVLILGPRGSGKEMLAQSIHTLSPRRDGPMLAINCGALPDQLVESELFGYEKGAFTGANAQKRGLFELAHNGTLFLDEIGELTLPAQTKLLRVLQTRQFRRVGATVELSTNARIIAATNRDLDEMTQVGNFRDDLLDRLSVWRLRIPPLNRRREEILPLAEEFLKRYGEGVSYTFDSSAKQFLLEKDYPGNIRVLENDIRRSIGNARAANTTLINAAMICEDFDVEKFTNLVEQNKTQPNSMRSDELYKIVVMEDIPNYEEAMMSFEKHLLTRALAACQWSKKIAANALGMSERTFWRAIQRHKLHTRPDDF